MSAIYRALRRLSGIDETEAGSLSFTSKGPSSSSKRSTSRVSLAMRWPSTNCRRRRAAVLGASVIASASRKGSTRSIRASAVRSTGCDYIESSQSSAFSRSSLPFFSISRQSPPCLFLLAAIRQHLLDAYGFHSTRANPFLPRTRTPREGSHFLVLALWVAM